MRERLVFGSTKHCSSSNSDKLVTLLKEDAIVKYLRVQSPSLINIIQQHGGERMSWFEAYLLWRLDAIQGICVSIAILFSTLVVCCIAGYIICESTSIDDDFSEKSQRTYKRYSQKWKKYRRISLIIFIPFLLLSLLVPSTSTVFKIVATKYGADALTSKTFDQYMGKPQKRLTTGLIY